MFFQLSGGLIVAFQHIGEQRKAPALLQAGIGLQPLDARFCLLQRVFIGSKIIADFIDQIVFDRIRALRNGIVIVLQILVAV